MNDNRFFFAISGLVLGACSAAPARPVRREVPTLPACHVADGSRVDLRGSAGCLVRIADRVLVVRHVDSGKLTVPGGHARLGESAQCTAHRETWEEAGVDVVVGPLLMTLDNGFHLFSCDVGLQERVRWRRALRAGTACQRPAETSVALLIRARELTPANYRFPRYLDRLKRAAGCPPAGHSSPTTPLGTLH